MLINADISNLRILWVLERIKVFLPEPQQKISEEYVHSAKEQCVDSWLFVIFGHLAYFNISILFLAEQSWPGGYITWIFESEQNFINFIYLFPLARQKLWTEKQRKRQKNITVDIFLLFSSFFLKYVNNILLHPLINEVINI